MTYSTPVRVLVTGGAGYIGSVVCEQLLDGGATVDVLDDLSLGHRAAVPEAATLHIADLGQRAAVDAVMARVCPDAIMHFAARSIVSESMARSGMWRYLGDNVTGGLNLVQSMVAHGVTRFILSSSAAVFRQPARVPIAEDEPIDPGSPYGESKHILERMLHWTEEVHGIRYASLRYFNAAGATDARGEHHVPETHLVPRVLQVALGQRESIVVAGDDYPTRDGTCIRDYVHVVDLAQAHLLALQALDERSRVYHVGTGTGSTVMEVIEAARAVTGHPIPHELGPRRAGDPPVLLADGSRIRAELGWAPRYPELPAIVTTAWRWHRAHPDGYRE